jgi:hypothetical protein
VGGRGSKVEVGAEVQRTILEIDLGILKIDNKKAQQSTPKIDQGQRKLDLTLTEINHDRSLKQLTMYTRSAQRQVPATRTK